MRYWLTLGIIALFVSVTIAQEPAQTPTSTPIPTVLIDPQEVLTSAEDGRWLVGDFYLVDPARPTVLLLHQLYTTRKMWQPVIGPLLGANYNVLAVDLRGYGKSRAPIEWAKAVIDVQTWLDWLRQEGGVRPDGISTMGSSMGSTLAIVGCANDPLCKTPIAISPGWDYFGIEIEDSLTIGLSTRPTLILYSQNDRWPAIGIPLMEEAATGFLYVEMYPANPHGLDLIKAHIDETIPLMLEWLATYGQ